MALASGQSLTHYELLQPLGAGGMGEVWRARDTRLGREVAIKVLPDELADDDERLRRFEREARTLASLNHTNVAGIHGVDQVDDVCFLALELVPGEDLADRLARGPLPVDEALDVCHQIAEGLEAAHEAGVVHRDLKPANVRVTPEGVVKLLDFGLAKPTHASSSGSASGGTGAADTDSFLMTEEGLVLGTPTYMSPEQARGKPVDRRTDIWAFGCVLYECLTGQRAFGGGSWADVLAAIVGQEPDLALLPPLPGRMRELLLRCLAKDPRVRLRDIGEARVLLQGGGPGDDEMRATPATAVGSSRGPLLGAAGLVLGAALGALWFGPLLGGGDEPPEQAALPAEPPRALRFAQPPLVGEDGLPMPWGSSLLSPDGTHLAASITDAMVIRALDSLETSRIPMGRSGSGSATWSPDGRFLAIIDGTAIRRVEPGGHNAVQIYSAPAGIQAMQGIAWLDSGRIVFCTAGDDGIQILSIPEGGGAATEVATIGDNMTDAHAHSISAIPGGRFLAVVHSFFGNTFKVQTEGDGGLRTLFELEDTNVLTAHWVPGGHLLFSRGEGEIADELWAVPLSLDPLEVTGEPFFVLGDATGESVSLNGTLAYTEKGKGQQHQLAWWGADGGTEPFGRQHERAITSAFRVRGGDSVFYVVGRTLPLELWQHDLRRGASTEISTGAMATMWAGTHPDGRIVYASVEIRDEGPVLNTYLLPASGRGEPELWFEGGVTGLSDTHALVGQLRDDQIDYYTHDLATGERSFLRSGEEISTIGAISRDGAWMVYSNGGQVFLTRFPSGEGEWQVSTEDGSGDAAFSPDGSEIRFTHSQGLFRVSLQTEPEVLLGLPELIGVTPEDTDVSVIPEEGSDRFLAVQSVGSDDSNLVVVLNWAAQLGAR